MRVSTRTLAVALSFSFLVGSLKAQQTHVVDPGSIDKALTAASEETLAKRQAILDALHQSEVQKVADRLGLDVARAEGAIATLDGVMLDQIAAQARMVNDAVTGGQTVRLNLLWVIIGLLVLILIIVAV